MCTPPPLGTWETTVRQMESPALGSLVAEPDSRLSILTAGLEPFPHHSWSETTPGTQAERRKCVTPRRQMWGAQRKEDLVALLPLIQGDPCTWLSEGPGAGWRQVVTRAALPPRATSEQGCTWCLLHSLLTVGEHRHVMQLPARTSSRLIRAEKDLHKFQSPNSTMRKQAQSREAICSSSTSP